MPPRPTIADFVHWPFSKCFTHSSLSWGARPTNSGFLPKWTDQQALGGARWYEPGLHQASFKRLNSFGLRAAILLILNVPTHR